MTTASGSSLQELQALVTNRLDPAALQGKRLCAILGDVPSTYAKSPKLWNAAFQALGAPAVFVPLDVPAGRLGEVVASLRRNESFLGGSVTVPYKIEILPLLDRLDPLAERIGAVNVIARSADGALTGYNTDGLGGVRALGPLLPSLAGAKALVIGAGGAAQAVAVYLWDALGSGELVIANRAPAAARSLAQRLSAMRAGHVSAITEAEIASRAGSADLIVNATVKGQAGIRKLPDGRWTCLEPYSGLAPAEPAAVPAMPGKEADWSASWLAQSREDIVRNNDASMRILSGVPRSAVCYDIIYAPLETAFLRHARWTGHRTLNGKAMNVIQAVEAFTRFVCRDWLASEGMSGEPLYRHVADAMEAEWVK